MSAIDRIEATEASYAEAQVVLDTNDLSNEGLVWYINATCFHPRGLALGINPTQPGEFTLFATADEAIQHANPEVCDEKFRRVETLVAALREKAKENRKEP